MGIRWAGSFGKKAIEQRNIKSMKTEYLNKMRIIVSPIPICHVGPAVCKARETEAGGGNGGGRNRGRQRNLLIRFQHKGIIRNWLVPKFVSSFPIGLDLLHQCARLCSHISRRWHCIRSSSIWWLIALSPGRNLPRGCGAVTAPPCRRGPGPQPSISFKCNLRRSVRAYLGSAASDNPSCPLKYLVNKEFALTILSDQNPLDSNSHKNIQILPPPCSCGPLLASPILFILSF
jgi:hypothetical protein